MLLLIIILALSIILNLLQYALIYDDYRQIIRLQTVIRKIRKGEDLDVDESLELVKTLEADETLIYKFIKKKQTKH